MHQFRQAYELDRTELGQFSESPEDRAVRRRIQELDRVALGEATRLFATSGNVAGRLERSTGLIAEVLPHPPQPLDYRSEASEGFVLSAGQARPGEARRPAARGRRARAWARRRRRRRRARPRAARGNRAQRGLNGRVRFEGRVSGERLAELYARCGSVYYAPVDEDFGMGPYESFLSSKPVITTADAGGPLDVVHDRETGLVVAPEASEVARAAAWLRDHADEARPRSGRRGKALADEVTWDRAIERLLG